MRPAPAYKLATTTPTALLAGAEILSRTHDLRATFWTTTETAMRFLGGSYGLLFAVRFTPPNLTVGLLGCCIADGADTYWASDWTHDVVGADSPNQQGIGDERAMTAPGHRFGHIRAIRSCLVN